MNKQPEYDFVSNKDMEIPEEITDFGDLLRRLRMNHAYSLQQLSKMVGLPVQQLSEIELSKREIPHENVLRVWLNKLGCGKANTNKIIQISRGYRVKHWIKLNRKESSNPDLLRLLDAYREDRITDYDRALLKLVAR